MLADIILLCHSSSSSSSSQPGQEVFFMIKASEPEQWKIGRVSATSPVGEVKLYPGEVSAY